MSEAVNNTEVEAQVGKDRLERWRQKLLDLSLRNRLLNVRDNQFVTFVRNLKMPCLFCRSMASKRRFSCATGSMAMQLLCIASISAGEDYTSVWLCSTDKFDRLHETTKLRVMVGFISRDCDVADGNRAFRTFEIAAVVVGCGVAGIREEIGQDWLCGAVHGFDEIFCVMIIMIVGDSREIEIRNKLL